MAVNLGNMRSLYWFVIGSFFGGSVIAVILFLAIK